MTRIQTFFVIDAISIVILIALFAFTYGWAAVSIAIALLAVYFNGLVTGAALE